MQNRLLEQDQVELERLQDLLDLKEKYKQYNTVGARVISKGSGNCLRFLQLIRKQGRHKKRYECHC